MANELNVFLPTSGETLNVNLYDATGQIWNSSAFVTPVGNYYAVAMSEIATGHYRATMPAAPAGVYTFVVRRQAGGSPAVTDTVIGPGRIEWDGSAEVTLTSRATAAAVEAADDAVLAAIADLPTNAEFEARTLPSADYTVVSDLPAAPDNASIAAILEDTQAIQTQLVANGGHTAKVYTLRSGGTPIAGVYCRLTTDAAGLVNISAGTTNSLGQVTFWHDLPTGTTVYVHAARDGYEPLVDTEVI